MLGRTLAGIGRLFRGVSTFFYVVSHWGEISEREEYRRQIKDRDDWLDSQRKNMSPLHEIEKERIAAEFGRVLAESTEVAGRVVTTLDRAMEQLEKYRDALEATYAQRLGMLADLIDATMLLAIILSFELPERRPRSLACSVP